MNRAIQEQVDLCLQDLDLVEVQNMYTKMGFNAPRLKEILDQARSIVTFVCQNAIDTQMTFFEVRGSSIHMSAICFYGSDEHRAWIQCNLSVGLSSVVEDPSIVEDVDYDAPDPTTEDSDLTNRVNELEKEVKRLRIDLGRNSAEHSVQNRKDEPTWSKIWECPMIPSNQD